MSAKKTVSIAPTVNSIVPGFDMDDVDDILAVAGKNAARNAQMSKAEAKKAEAEAKKAEKAKAKKAEAEAKKAEKAEAKKAEAEAKKAKKAEKAKAPWVDDVSEEEGPFMQTSSSSPFKEGGGMLGKRQREENADVPGSAAEFANGVASDDEVNSNDEGYDSDQTTRSDQTSKTARSDQTAKTAQTAKSGRSGRSTKSRKSRRANNTPRQNNMPEEVQNAKTWLVEFNKNLNKAAKKGKKGVPNSEAEAIKDKIESFQATLKNNQEMFAADPEFLERMQSACKKQIKSLQEQLEKVEKDQPSHVPSGDYSEQHKQWMIILRHLLKRGNARVEEANVELLKAKSLVEFATEALKKGQTADKTQPFPHTYELTYVR